MISIKVAAGVFTFEMTGNRPVTVKKCVTKEGKESSVNTTVSVGDIGFKITHSDIIIECEIGDLLATAKAIAEIKHSAKKD